MKKYYFLVSPFNLDVMLKNYLKIASRNLFKNKVFSLINILGLALGIGASLLLVQYVNFELSYDQFHQHADNTYRVTLDVFKNAENEVQSARVSPAVATAFQNEFPAIENFTRLVILGPDGVLTYEDQFIGESGIYLADSAFFDVFSYQLIYGNPKTVFNDPFSIVITKKTAHALFKDENPVGKTIVINADNFDGESVPFKVTGVVENFPENSYLQPGALVSYTTLFEFVGHRFDDSWNWNETYTYFQLHDQTDPTALEAKFPEVVHRFNQQQLDENQLDWQYKLQPIKNIHLHSDLQSEASVTGNAQYVYFLGMVGLIILLIGYINFINLITVKALQRAKEVGVRKVSGAQRWQLIMQFFLEAALVNALAVLLGITFVQVGQSFFSNLFEVKFSFNPDMHTTLWAGYFLFLLFLVLTSGFYPAIILSRYNPVKVLKGNFAKGRSGAFLRKTLVTGQFAIALVLIALTLTAAVQIRFMQQQSLGFNPEQIMVVKGPKAFDYGYGNNFTAFRNKLNALAQVQGVSASMVVPGQEIYAYDDQIEINNKETSGIFSIDYVTSDYFSTYNIPFLSGQTLNEGENVKWVINESALKLLGFDAPEDAIAQTIKVNGQDGDIIGVVKDFHHQSLKEAINPTLFSTRGPSNYYSISMETTKLGNTLEKVKNSYMELFPGSPYEYFFLDEFFDRQYKAEQQFNALFRLFSGMAIFIACLGLFGLASYTATQRTKEIGIRKVLGASVKSIVSLLTQDFIRLVLLASIIALPLAYWTIYQWLENYAFRIDISWWLLFIPVLTILFIALISVSFQTIRAAIANPAKSLRYE